MKKVSSVRYLFILSLSSRYFHIDKKTQAMEQACKTNAISCQRNTVVDVNIINESTLPTISITLYYIN